MRLFAVVVLALCAVGCKKKDKEADSGTVPTTETGTPAGTAGGTVTSTPLCGDEVVDPGEECDHGTNNGPDKPCLPDCTLSTDVTLELDGSMLTTYGVDGIAVSDVSLTGSGAWRATPSEDTNSDGFDKFELYVGPEAPYMEMLAGLTVADIASVSYATHKGQGQGSPDFYLVIYTKADGNDDQSWFGYRLLGEPLYSPTPDAPANQWNTWSTGAGTNQLAFNDSHKSGNLGFYGGPTLAEIQAGPIDWSAYYGAAPASAIDYGAEEIHFLAIHTGAPWESTFNGAIDDIRIELTNGSRLTVDLER